MCLHFSVCFAYMNTTDCLDNFSRSNNLFDVNRVQCIAILYRRGLNS